MKSDFIALAHNSEDILKIAKQIQQQSLLPNFIVFALLEPPTFSSNCELSTTLKKLGQLFDNNVDFVITRIFDTTCPYECIDICVKKCKGNYYSVLLADQELPDYFNFQLDTIIANSSTNMIRPKKGLHGLVVYRNLHKHLGGSRSFDENNEPYLDKITDKILGYAKEETIYEWQN